MCVIMLMELINAACGSGGKEIGAARKIFLGGESVRRKVVKLLTYSG